ncbi:MAG: serine hydrolase domain-containing protein [Niveispirillum sp.]|uniref:serine hydrolase domain-containing protein n=1 Tax=Niveispirillum sp. TaxID=1917217 RepID=UPI0040375A44
MIHGYCTPKFEGVRAEFARNFENRGEIGASVAIYVGGTLEVSLWGGVADAASSRAWEEDTLAAIFSSTKGLSATCMHILADRGLITFDAPVARYWPEFAANGKAGITVGMVLAHQAGMPVFREPLPDAGLTDWRLIVSRLEAEAPVWAPGTQSGYHAVTIGYLLGEILRRVTGRTIGQFLRDNVAGPLGADVWIGLPAELHDKVATAYFDAPSPDSALFRKIVEEPQSLAGLLVFNSGNDHTPESVNSAARRSAENPSAGGIASAKGLARVYAPLALDGSVDGLRLVSRDMLPYMRYVRSAAAIDPILQVATAFTSGFSKSWGDRRRGEGEHAIIGEQAFGTAGAGGSMGFADPQAQMSFGYVMNRLGPGIALNNRCQSLIDAAYTALGFAGSDPGFWIR